MGPGLRQWWGRLMTFKWSDTPVKLEEGTPYSDWFLKQDDNAKREDEQFVISKGFDFLPGFRQKNHDASDNARNEITEALKYSFILPEKSKNPNDPDDWNTDQIIDKMPCVKPDAVLVGIIDTGIALGHRRFRDKNGYTRFISAWQQSTTFGCQSYMPFGEELYSDKINCLLKQHSRGNDLTQRLDEDMFNREASLIEPKRRLGHRDLEHMAAHGTHVLDLAAGFDPATTQAEELKKSRIIAVNLPPQSLHGSAGNFLALWVVFAFERILHVSDALWKKNFGEKKGGYPLVINISYGMQAGPKDGTSPLERYLRSRLRARQVPVRLVMPAGNDNLERSHLRGFLGRSLRPCVFKSKPNLTAPLRIQPDDWSSTYAEIWTKSLKPWLGVPVEYNRSVALKDVKLTITPPGHPPLPAPKLKDGEFIDLMNDAGKTVARLYAFEHRRRAQFVLAIGPTRRQGSEKARAPAGLWKIDIAYRKCLIDVNVFVQSDQSPTAQSRKGLQAYFDHPAYKVMKANGRPRDSFDYETGCSDDDYGKYGPVQIKGSQNALISLKRILAVGGYRVSDGRPALYSGTAHDFFGSENARNRIDASFPSEVAPAHFGLLASGSRDGSSASFRGTSMATALCTRAVAKELTNWDPNKPDPKLANNQWLIDAANKAEGDYMNYKPIHPLKSGFGRLPLPPNDVNRHRFRDS